MVCLFSSAGVAELADAADSKSADREVVWVRVPPPAFISSGRKSLIKGFPVFFRSIVRFARMEMPIFRMFCNMRFR